MEKYMSDNNFISLKDAKGNRFIVNKNTIKTVIEYVNEDGDYQEGVINQQYIIVDFFDDEAIKVADSFEDVANRLSTSL